MGGLILVNHAIRNLICIVRLYSGDLDRCFEKSADFHMWSIVKSPTSLTLNENYYLASATALIDNSLYIVSILHY